MVVGAILLMGVLFIGRAFLVKGAFLVKSAFLVRSAIFALGALLVVDAILIGAFLLMGARYKGTPSSRHTLNLYLVWDARKERSMYGIQMTEFSVRLIVSLTLKKSSEKQC